MTENSVSLLGKIAGFTEILAKDPQSTVFVSLSEAYRQLGMLDDALEIADKGTMNLPGFSPGFVTKGRVLAQQGDLAKAALAFEQALAVERDSLQALKGLARTRFRQGYMDKARELLMRARLLSPEDPVIGKMLTSLGASVGNQAVGPVPDETDSETVPVAAPEAVPPSSPDSEVGSTVFPEAPPVDDSSLSSETFAHKQSAAMQTTTLANLYFKQGLYDEAAAIYREILSENPHDEDVRSRLVKIKNLQNRAIVQEEETVSQPVDSLVAADVAPSEQAGQEPLDVFHRWLNAIEKRRAHVC